MKVVVCVKQIPDPNTTGQLDPTTHLLKREGVEVVLDPGDEFGVEAGLQLVEAQGGEVTVVSMGPERGIDAVRKALAMGAAKGVLISDDALRGLRRADHRPSSGRGDPPRGVRPRDHRHRVRPTATPASSRR